MRYIILIVLLSGCDSLYYKPMPEGMVVIEHHYTDIYELREVCGQQANACAFVADNHCDIYLPLAANGDPMYREHELRHCGGGLDAPKFYTSERH